jgi:hypothetical protein
MQRRGSTSHGQVFAYFCFIQTGRSCVDLWHSPHCSFLTGQSCFASSALVIQHVITEPTWSDGRIFQMQC